jgi:hypothetical protein
MAPFTVLFTVSQRLGHTTIWRACQQNIQFMAYLPCRNCCDTTIWRACLKKYSIYGRIYRVATVATPQYREGSMPVQNIRLWLHLLPYSPCRNGCDTTVQILPVSQPVKKYSIYDPIHRPTHRVATVATPQQRACLYKILSILPYLVSQQLRHHHTEPACTKYSYFTVSQRLRHHNTDPAYEPSCKKYSIYGLPCHNRCDTTVQILPMSLPVKNIQFIAPFTMSQLLRHHDIESLLVQRAYL